MKENPIGLFDSGIGGTSIYKAVNKLLPNESTIYLADSANAPYGPKGREWIIERMTQEDTPVVTQDAVDDDETSVQSDAVQCDWLSDDANDGNDESLQTPEAALQPTTEDWAEGEL